MFRIMDNIGRMKFHSGDKVGFINENMEGVVVRVLGDGLCRVRVDDGFEFDVHEKELVLLQKVKEADIPSSPAVAAAKAVLGEAGPDPFRRLEAEVFYFAACPGEEMQVLTGPVRFYIVNKLSFDAAFSFTVRVGKACRNLVHGEVRAGEARLLVTCPREELIDWSAMNLQALFYKGGLHDLLPPLNKDLPMVLPDLASSEKGLEGLWAYSKVTRLASTNLAAATAGIEALKDKYTAPKPESRKAERSARRPPQDQGPVLINESEIDLHIQHLADDYRTLTNAQILQIQMRRFRQEMDLALKHHYKKITFIHGVGNGVLRNEIHRELRSWSGIVFHDAPFEKYGYGATQVVFL